MNRGRPRPGRGRFRSLVGRCRAVAFAKRVCHKRDLPPSGSFRAAVAAAKCSSARSYRADHRWTGRTAMAASRRSRPEKESQMPKLKTKSGAKKRFKVTGTGKVLYAQRGKRHGMIKRTNKQIRNLRGTQVLFKTDGDNIIKYFLPNG